MIELQKTAAGRLLLVVIVLIIIAFGAGVLRLNSQATQINEILKDQALLSFEFERLGPNQQNFILDCTRNNLTRRYDCKPVPALTSTATPAPTAISR